MKVFYLKHIEIDKVKWDFVIGNSYNGIIYAYSWYLDIVCPFWDALVSDDYSFIMPLPAKNKYGINYLLQPVFMQQGGIFSPEEISEKKISDFISAIPSKFKYIHLSMNVNIKAENKLFKRRGITMHLDLNRSYREIHSDYNSNTKRNLKQANDCGLIYTFCNDSLCFVDLIKQTKLNSEQILKPNHYLMIKKLIDETLKRDKGELVSVANSSKILSMAFFLKTHSGIINLLNISTPDALESKAMFFLFDNYFQFKANNPIIFDFEGSSIPGVARFYKGFGAETRYFPILKQNNLPFPLKYIKK